MAQSTAEVQHRLTSGDQVELSVPAEPAYVAIVRTATAGLAARVDLTLDRIEDLRIAVDEACALLVSDATAGAALNCTFTLDDHALQVEVAGPPHPLPPATSFAWAVLSALVDGLEHGTDQQTWIRLRVHRAEGTW